MGAYDSNNVFAKILRGEIPAKVIAESEHSLAFYDAFPKAKIHALVITKNPYVNLSDFCTQAPAHELQDFWALVEKAASQLELPQQGFRLISNSGPYGGQEVPHFHIHLLGGQPLGPMVSVSKAT